MSMFRRIIRSEKQRNRQPRKPAAAYRRRNDADRPMAAQKFVNHPRDQVHHAGKSHAENILPSHRFPGHLLQFPPHAGDFIPFHLRAPFGFPQKQLPKHRRCFSAAFGNAPGNSLSVKKLNLRCFFAETAFNRSLLEFIIPYSAAEFKYRI